MLQHLSFCLNSNFISLSLFLVLFLCTHLYRLLAQALEGGGDGRSESESNTHKSATNDASSGTAAAANSLNPTKLAAAAEDKFHLRAKKKGGVDPSTGLLERDEEPVDEDEELPEDRFHRDDALSAHYISQREGDRKEKRDRAEKEREDRKARQASGKTDGIDDHIDYIDVEGERGLKMPLEERKSRELNFPLF